LTVDGNATLGNATNDAVTVSGYMGVGGAGNAGQGLRLTSNALTGTSQYGAFLVPVGTSSGTTAVYGLAVAAGTAASAYTANLVRQIYTGDAVKGAGSTITSLQGIYVDDLTAGTNNYGITSAVSSGSNKWNIYASGTADNYFAGNVGIGTTSPSSFLYNGLVVGGGTGNIGLTLFSNSTGIGSIAFADSSSGAARYAGHLRYLHSSNAFTFDTEDVERMRLNSTGLGIGTSSPGTQLQVTGTGTTLSGSTTYNLQVNSSSTGYGVRLGQDGTNGTISGIGTSGLTFWTYNGSAWGERLRIDSSGRVGINYTPGTGGGLLSVAYNSATLYSTAGSWPGSADAAFSGTYAINASATTGSFVSNTFVVRNGSSVYQAAGMSAVSVAGSGRSPTLNFWAQDGASTFATRMTLDASGNLGLGVTPSAWYAGAKAFQFGGTGAILNNGSNVSYYTHNAYFDTGWKYIGTGFANYFAMDTGVYKWFTAPSGTAGNTISFTQAMTLNASGELLLGTTSAFNTNAGRANVSINGSSTAMYNLGVAGASAGYLYHSGTDMWLNNVKNGILSFYTNNAERSRITADGFLLVGRTSEITFSTNTTDGITLKPDRIDVSAASVARITQVRDATGTLDRFYNGSNIVGSITCTTTATAYNTSSDSRLKSNIAAADDAGSVVDSIQIVKHDWKAGGHVRYGVIAQDLYAVAPEAVKVGDDSEEVTDAWGVDYSKLVPMLVKEIQSLRARVAQLESK